MGFHIDSWWATGLMPRAVMCRISQTISILSSVRFSAICRSWQGTVGELPGFYPNIAAAVTLPGNFGKRLQASQGPSSKGNVAHFRQELGKVFVDVQMTQVRYLLCVINS